MTFFKRTKTLFISLIAVALMLMVGCSSVQKAESSSVNILCTGFSQYDWIRNITKDVDGINVSLLLENGVDMHSYQPTAEDIIKIKSSDMIVFTGGQSDTAIYEVIKNSPESKTVVFDMMKTLGEDSLIRTEHSDTRHTHHEGDYFSDYDEHIFLSIKNAKKLCQSIANSIILLDPVNEESYNINTFDYIDKLSLLDNAYEAVVSASPQKTLVFADRFPFAYLARDYSIECFAAFPGCSSETDAGFDVILQLASKIDELGLSAVMTTDGGTSGVDEAVISNTKAENIKTLSLESLQSVTADEASAGLTYLSAMEDNLEILNEALK